MNLKLFFKINIRLKITKNPKPKLSVRTPVSLGKIKYIGEKLLLKLVKYCLKTSDAGIEVEKGLNKYSTKFPPKLINFQNIKGK